MDANDLELVVGQLREMMARVGALETKEAIPDLSQKLGAVTEQLEAMKALLAAEPPEAAEVAESDDAEEPTPSPEPSPVPMNAFAADHGPSDSDTRVLILRLLSTAEPSPDDLAAYEEDGSVWKVDWSSSTSESTPSKSEPKQGDASKPEIWEDLSEGW